MWIGYNLFKYYLSNQLLQCLRTNSTRFLLIFLMFLPLVDALQGTTGFGLSQAPPPSYWPTDEWLTSTPKDQGMDSSLLTELLDYIDVHYSSTIDSLIIVRNGYIVLEAYPSGLSPDYLHVLHSVTKSFTSALIGIAIQEGFIDSVHQKVVDFFPDRSIANLTSLKQVMTLEHLLTMTTGFEWDEWQYPYTDTRNGLIRAITSGDFVQYMLDLPVESVPGTVWTYCTGASHLLSAILEEVTNQSTLAFAQDYLFDPLGISSVYWGSDSQGVYFGGSELYLKPRDMAKFGLLFLNNGTWDGQQIVPNEWVLNSTSTLYHQFSDDYNGYGYQWWTWPSLGGVYYASGLYQQKIIVVPEHDLVVVFTADLREGADPEPALLYHFILPAVVDETNTAFKIDRAMIVPLFGLVVIISPAIVFLVYLRKEQKHWHSLSAGNPDRT
jgi:CubicO group peptidase (beta-lactamase class C family)